MSRKLSFELKIFQGQVLGYSLKSLRIETGFRAEWRRSRQTFGEQSLKSFAISGSNARKSSSNVETLYCISQPNGRKNPLKY